MLVFRYTDPYEGAVRVLPGRPTRHDGCRRGEPAMHRDKSNSKPFQTNSYFGLGQMQRPKNLVSVSALPTGKFLRVGAKKSPGEALDCPKCL